MGKDVYNNKEYYFFLNYDILKKKLYKIYFKDSLNLICLKEYFVF